MSTLATQEKAKFANKPQTSVGLLSAATAGALGSDTNGVTVYTPNSGGTNWGGMIYSLNISTDDSAIVNVFIYILNGSTVKPLGIVNVPANSGNTAALQNIDAIRGTGVTIQGLMIDSAGKPFIQLGAGDVLKCATLANMTAAKKCHVVAQGNDFAVDPTA